MKNFWEKEEVYTRKINKKKIAIVSIITILLIAIFIIVILYIKNENIRQWIDKNVLNKEITQDGVITIDLVEENADIYAFNKYIGVLSKGKLQIYGNTGNKEEELDIQVSSPIFDSANRFLAIADSNGHNAYLITDKEITWETEVEGDISQISVNKNGYVAVVIVDTSYKTVIQTFSPDGTPLFKSFLSTTRVADVSISNDNKYMAIAEVDTSGTLVQSNLKIISIEKASKKSSSNDEESVENKYASQIDKLITNIEYQDKDRLVCMYTDSMSIIEDGQEQPLIDVKDKKIIFQSVELANHACQVKEKSSGLFTADSVITIINVENKSSKEYVVNSVAKEIYTYGNIIALNLGTEIEFINTGGWLAKRYIANQEITSLVISDNVAGIVYHDKIEIVNL